MLVTVRRLDNNKTYQVEAEGLRWWLPGDYRTVKYALTRPAPLKGDAPYMLLGQSSNWCAQVMVVEVPLPAPPPPSLLTRAFRVIRGEGSAA